MGGIRNIKRKNIYNPTDLRVVLSGVDEGSVGANITQTVTLTNLGLSRSENTVIKVYLPEGVTFVSSPNGVHSGGVITWTRGTVKDAFTDTFVVTSADADDYEIIAVVETTTYDIDPANSTDTHTLTIEASEYAIEIRSSNIFFGSYGGVSSVTALTGAVSGDMMGIFVEDIAPLGGNVYRLGYLTEAIPAQSITVCAGYYAAPYDGSQFYYISTPAYNGSDPTYTINTEGEAF